MTPRSDYEHSVRLVEMGEITPEPQLYIDVSVIEYETMKKRIADLEAQLAAERNALLFSASDVVGMDVRIKELEAAYAEIVNAPYEAAQGRIAELEATMEFYANSDNYKENYDGLNAPYTYVVKDGGKRARRALEQGKP